MSAVFFILACFTAFFALCLIWAYWNRSPLDEALERAKRGTYFKVISALGRQIMQRMPSWYDTQGLETSLRLANKNMGAELFLGISVVMIAAGYLVGELVSSMTGWGVWATVGVTAVLLSIWWGSLFTEAKKAREEITMQLISWSVLELKEVVSSGITDPEEAAIRQATQDEGKLAQEFRKIVHAIDTNTPLYAAFYDRFVDCLDIDEALDLAMLFEDAKLLGTPIAKQLETINKIFLEERRYRFRVKINRMVTELAVVMALVLTLAAGLMLGGPVYLSTMDFIK